MYKLFDTENVLVQLRASAAALKNPEITGTIRKMAGSVDNMDHNEMVKNIRGMTGILKDVI